MAIEHLIIGGGIIGLSIARELRLRTGSSVTVYDAGDCGKKASWAAAGMLGANVETTRRDLFHDLCVRSRDMFPDLADALMDETGIDIGLDRRGTLSLALTDQELASLRAEFAEFPADTDAELLSDSDVRRAEPFISPDVRGAIYHRGDWQVDNRALVRALIASCLDLGVEIVENAAVENVIIENGNAVGVVVDGAEVAAGDVILANGAWASLIKFGVAMPSFSVKPIRGQIVEFHTAKRLFEHVLHSRRGYLVPRNDGRILAGATTEDVGFDDSTTEAASAELSRMAYEISPSLANLTPGDHWSGLRPFAADGLPVIGRPQGIGNLLIATAHYRNGILLAPATAGLVGDAVSNAEDPTEFTAFGPERLRFATRS